MFAPAHILSNKSARQHRNVFIWCGFSHKLAMGWRVNDDTPITVSTAYRWVTTAIQTRYPGSESAKSYALFSVVVQPSGVLMYSVERNGPALSRESQGMMIPGDYGIYAIDGSNPQRYYLFAPTLSFSDEEKATKEDCATLAAKASLTSSIIQQALDRDRQCIFSGAVLSSDSDALVATWIFPPFLGYKLSDDEHLGNKYYMDPDACDLSEFMVATNTLSGRKDLVTLFWENKLGVDVTDKYRIMIFERSESLKGDKSLRSHLNLVDGPHRPSDHFLRLHFQQCLAVSACGGDAREDYYEQEIDNFMEELGVFDGGMDKMDIADPRWASPLGTEVYAYLIRRKLTEYADEEVEF